MDIRKIPHTHRNQPIKMAEISLKDYENDFLDKLTFLEKEMSLSSINNMRDLCQFFGKDDDYIVKMLKKIKISEVIYAPVMIEHCIKEIDSHINSKNEKELKEEIFNGTESVQGLDLNNPFNIEEKIIALEVEDKQLTKSLNTVSDSETYFDLINRKKNTVKAMYFCLLSKNINTLEKLNLNKGTKYVSLILQDSNYQRALKLNNRVELPLKESPVIKKQQRNKNIRRMEMKLKKGS